MEQEKISFIAAFRTIFQRLPARKRRQFWLLFAYMLFSSTVATISAGAIALFAAAASSPQEVLSVKYFSVFQQIVPGDFWHTPRGVMVFLSGLMVFLVALKNILESLLLYCVARYGASVEAHFGTILFKGFLDMPYQWHLNHNSADIVLAMQWRSYIGYQFINTSLKIMSDTLLVLFLMLTIFLMNPYVSISVFVLFGGMAFFIYSRVHRIQERQAEKCRNYEQAINREVTKGIHGIKDVKVSGQASFLADFTRDVYSFARIRGMREVFTRLPVGLLETIGFVGLSGAIIIMLFFTRFSSIEITAIISLIVVVAWRTLPAVIRIMIGLTSMRNILPYFRKEMDYIKEIESEALCLERAARESSSQLTFQSEIELKHVSFAYQGRKQDVLTNINLTISKGQTVGIVGCSGVGKSTLVDIIIGLLQPRQGQVLVDGVPLRVDNLYSWMKRLSYVPQSPYIFDGTIAENIAFGVSAAEIDRARVIQCCHMAYMQDVLAMLPQGIDTLIGERGVRLSGGQRQRVAIARALYTKPEVMIFDEATSSLDSKSEKAIQDTIGALKGSKTLIIVAHRLKTVEECDLLIWLEKGGVRMVGRPPEVLPQYELALL